MDELLILNLADAPARSHPRRATIIELERDADSWPDTGINVRIMQPGQPNCRYDREDTDQLAEAYADWRRQPWEPIQNPWPLGEIR